MLGSAKILAERRYLTVTDLHNGTYRIELTTLAKARSSDQ
jgi:hypothetical protein